MEEGTRLREPKSLEEEGNFIDEATPASTKYNNKWAVNIFKEWQISRKLKLPVLDPRGLFKAYHLARVAGINTELQDMDATSLNYWLSKFVMEVAKKNGERYPPIVCAIRRYLVKKNGPVGLNPLDSGDKRFLLFRRALDAEMKDGTKQGIHVTTKKEEKECVMEEEERQFWRLKLLGRASAKSLLNTVYKFL